MNSCAIDMVMSLTFPKVSFGTTHGVREFYLQKLEEVVIDDAVNWDKREAADRHQGE